MWNVLPNLPFPFIFWHQADDFFASCEAHVQFYLYDHTLTDAFTGSSWPTDQFLIMVNWDKLLLFPFSRTFTILRPAQDCQSPQQVVWRKTERSIQVLTTDFCCLAIEIARPSAKYTFILIKTVLSCLFSPGKIR